MHAHQQAALVEFGRSALVGTDLQILLQRTAELVAHTLDVEFSKIQELHADGSTLVIRAGVGWKEGVVEHATIGAETTSPAGYTLSTSAPVIVRDWNIETHFEQPTPLRDYQVISGLYVSIQGLSRPFGVLGVECTQHRLFADDDIRFLQVVANLLGLAIERFQAEEALRASQARFRRLAENAADIMYRYHFTPTPGFDYVSPASTSITGYTPADYYADPQLGLRMAHPADRSQLEAATQTPTMMDVPLRTRLICKDGRQIWTEQRIVPLLDTAGELIGVEGIVRDITERVEAYQMLEQRVEERTREIESRRAVAEGLREILAILNSNRPLDEILDYIIAQACHLLGTPSGAIYRLNRQEGMLSTRASHGLDAADATLSLPVSWDPVGETVMQRQPVAVTNTALAISGRCTPTTSTQHQTCLARLSEQYRALLIVPLIVKDDVYGAIALYYHEPRAFSDEEIRLACAVSDQAALAVENARLVVAAQGKAVLEERQRLARDLHDSVTQALYGITLYAEAAARILMSGDTVTVADQLRDLQEMARGALQEMRLLIFELRPPVLEAEGLVVALRTRLETVEGRSNLKTTFTMEGMSRLSAPIEQALYRIAQEALNNALKHARAHHVTVFLWQEQSRVLLEVADDGVGFDPAIAREQGGLGLRGIEERVAQLGGQLALQSAPGGGTRVRVEICV